VRGSVPQTATGKCKRVNRAALAGNRAAASSTGRARIFSGRGEIGMG